MVSSSSNDDPVKIFLLSVSVFCFTFSFLIMCALCYRQAQRITAVNEVGNFEVHLRSGIVWLTGSQRQAEKIDLILQKLHAERRTKIMHMMTENKMVVTEADLKVNEQFSEDDASEEQCAFYIIPPPFKRQYSDNEKDIEVGQEEQQQHEQKLEPGECVICLCPYKVHDILLWSQNEQCMHVFHCDCILTWLMKKQSAECPCCRRNFLDQTAQLNTTK